MSIRGSVRLERYLSFSTERLREAASPLTRCRSLQQVTYEYQQQLSDIPLISEHVLVVKASNHHVMPNMDNLGRGVPRACQRYFVYSGDRVGPATSTTSLQPGEDRKCGPSTTRTS